MRIGFLVGWWLLLWLLSIGVGRAAPLVRAIYPNPPGSDTGEWVMIENPDSATVSANVLTLSDTQGSLKTWRMTTPLEPQSLTTFLFSQTGISLNNAKDGVVLASGSGVLDTSAEYVNADEGFVWWRSTTGWTYSLAADFQGRAALRQWELPVPEDDSGHDPEPTTVVASPTPVPRVMSPSAAKREVSQPENVTAVPSPSLAPLKLPTLIAVTTPYVPRTPLPSAPPIPDPDAEVATFVAWQKQAIGGSLAVMFAGVCWLTIALPPLIRGYLAFDDW